MNKNDLLLSLLADNGNSPQAQAEKGRKGGLARGYKENPETTKNKAGENSGKAKLNWDKVTQIREFSAKGVSAAALARHFGIHARTVRYVIAGESWKEEHRP